jgi:hypothetical protein
LTAVKTGCAAIFVLDESATSEAEMARHLLQRQRHRASSLSSSRRRIAAMRFWISLIKEFGAIVMIMQVRSSEPCGEIIRFTIWLKCLESWRNAKGGGVVERESAKFGLN